MGNRDASMSHKLSEWRDLRIPPQILYVGVGDTSMPYKLSNWMDLRIPPPVLGTSLLGQLSQPRLLNFSCSGKLLNYFSLT